METYTDIDRRDLDLVVSYQEERIAAMRNRIRELEAEVERLRQNLKERQ